MEGTWETSSICRPATLAISSTTAAYLRGSFAASAICAKPAPHSPRSTWASSGSPRNCPSALSLPNLRLPPPATTPPHPSPTLPPLFPPPPPRRRRPRLTTAVARGGPCAAVARGRAAGERPAFATPEPPPGLRPRREPRHPRRRAAHVEHGERQLERHVVRQGRPQPGGEQH